MRVGLVGLGFVGGAIYATLLEKKCDLRSYDLFKKIGAFEDVIATDILFLCLPTQYDASKKAYDKSAIYDTCCELSSRGYKGVIVIKSTVEPTTTGDLATKYPSLSFVHNPEFLTAATAEEDFANQKHIVLGGTPSTNPSHIDMLRAFYSQHFQEAEISVCSSTESESMKIFANTFYAVKIQYFNEVYAACENMGANYDTVRDLIVKNGWVNPMHTNVPGTDGKLSYGGLCFPKDTNAIAEQMGREDIPNGVIKATIEERDKMRNDNFNIIIAKDNINEDLLKHV
jgi:UDPglucose 6-dehydrogenase